MSTSSHRETPQKPYDVYLPTPQSLPRALGTQFTPGIGETTVVEEKETIPFQDLSKLAKRMEWAVIKMTNVLSLIRLSNNRFHGTQQPTQFMIFSGKTPRLSLTKSMLNRFT